jgi:Uma2 family endonuclease
MAVGISSDLDERSHPMKTAARPIGAAPAVLENIDWQTYSRLLKALSGRRFRLTYDRGTLEIMSPLWIHERPSALLACFIVVLTEEFNLPRLEGGSVTLRRRRKQRGLEPDKCWWIANARRLHGRTRLDLRTDPPPDLAVEVDVTSSSLDRMSIYAALGVPEVWRVDQAGLTFNALQGRRYQAQPNSLSFPLLASADLLPFLAQMGQTDDTTLVREFREWVHQHLLTRTAPGTPPAPPPALPAASPPDPGSAP